MKRILPVFFVSLVVLAAAPLAFSKGSTERIIIKGGGLARSIEITDTETLRGFDPWSGQFIDWSKGPVAVPPNQEQSYEVFFYMKWEGRRSPYDLGSLKMIYALRYCPPVRDGEPGYIYLPGRNDGYSVNASTILREDADGKWHQASPAWNALMKRLTAASKPNGKSQSGRLNEMLLLLWTVGSALA